MDYKSDGTKNTNWVANSNANVTNDDSTGETTVSATANATYRSTQLLSGDFEAILEAKTDNTEVRVGFTNLSKHRRVSFNQSSYNYIKFRRVNGEWTIQRSANGENWITYTSYDASSLSNEDCYFIINIAVPSGGQRSITYKNLKIYPI